MSLSAIGTAHLAPRSLWLAPNSAAVLGKIARTLRPQLAIGYHLTGGTSCGAVGPACRFESDRIEHANHVPGRRGDIGVDRRGLLWPFSRGLGALIYDLALVQDGPLGAWLDLGPRAVHHVLGQPPCPRLGGELDVVA